MPPAAFAKGLTMFQFFLLPLKRMSLLYNYVVFFLPFFSLMIFSNSSDS